MGFDEFYRLFERCLVLAERVDPEDREALLEIAEACLQLAHGCEGEHPRAQNAPTTLLPQ
jgi:hypothetical protein